MIDLRADADVSTSNMLLLPIKIATIESMIMSRFDALSRTPNIDFRGKKMIICPSPENALNPYIYISQMQFSLKASNTLNLQHHRNGTCSLTYWYEGKLCSNIFVCVADCLVFQHEEKLRYNMI
jgi:hypothetical protein